MCIRDSNYGVLVSGKYGNSNTLKIEEDGGRYLVALKRSRVPVYTDMEIFEEYNRVALERGWKPLKSPRILREWFNSPRVEPLWYDCLLYTSVYLAMSSTSPACKRLFLVIPTCCSVRV